MEFLLLDGGDRMMLSITGLLIAYLFVVTVIARFAGFNELHRDGE